MRRQQGSVGNASSNGALSETSPKPQRASVIESYLSESTSERGGRHKRIYLLTRMGKQALLEIHEVERKMWAGIPKLVLD